MPVTYNFFQRRFGKERKSSVATPGAHSQLLQKAWRHLLLKLRVNSRVLTYTSLSSSNQGNPTAATARKPLIDLDEIGCVCDFSFKVSYSNSLGSTRESESNCQSQL